MSRAYTLNFCTSGRQLERFSSEGSVAIRRRRSSPAATRRGPYRKRSNVAVSESGRPVVGSNRTAWDCQWCGALTSSRRNSSSSARSVMPRTRPWKSITVERKDAPRGRRCGVH
ncbi:hypothetical protein ZWY2020_034736 [Hordeum vulgare]|nr:hypothetical protein ZWY2020_034736 [Hordeum vulgare]